MHLESFIFQLSRCQLILDRFEEAETNLIKLIKSREKFYTFKGCCSVDPIKLLLTPYQLLCYIYEARNEDSKCLNVC